MGDAAVSEDTRWKAVCIYRSEIGQIDVEHYFEELAELDTLIECGPHWDTLVSCTVAINRPAEYASLTIERALEI